MIKINKDNEPLEWTAKKSTPGFTTYAPINEVRKALLIEQGYICAYCMRRIPAKDIKVDATSKIEHIKSQEDRPDLQRSYANMAICCPGNLNDDPHCDKRKGSRSVTFDLHTDFLQESISYSSKNGDIKSSNIHWNDEINSLLNLNHGLLKANRKEALDGVIEFLKASNWNSATIKTQYQPWRQVDAEGKKFPFCGIVIWYLGKKLAK